MTIRTLLTGALLALILLALSGCHDRPKLEYAPIPVAQPCAKARPEPVQPLRDTIPPQEWQGLTVKQKAAQVASQGLKRANYGDALNAATAACPEIR